MNERGHLNEDVLLDAIYGIARADAQAHAEACPECAARLKDWRQRAQTAASSEISSEFLATQRRSIYARIENPPRRLWWWVPGLVAAAALIVGIVVDQPRHSKATVAHSEVSDAQLFKDIYALERSAEPSAAEPVHALFEDRAQ